MFFFFLSIHLLSGPWLNPTCSSLSLSPHHHHAFIFQKHSLHSHKNSKPFSIKAPPYVTATHRLPVNLNHQPHWINFTLSLGHDTTYNAQDNFLTLPLLHHHHYHHSSSSVDFIDRIATCKENSQRERSQGVWKKGWIL